MRLYLLCFVALVATGAFAGEFVRLTHTDLLDRIRGGWAGQMIGNIQGLPYEFKYEDSPGPLPDFTPNLPVCRSDDDTDIEWTHLHAMDRLGVLEVPYPELARAWVLSVNRKIWVSNKRARELIGQGVVPPWTSHFALNDKAAFNLSGQFCTEAYGFLAPGLPNTAARLGRHYAWVTVRGEPIQACAFTTALVSLAFFERDVPRLIAQALKTVDPASQHAEMVRDVLAWHRLAPDDWQGVRGRIQRKYRDERKWNTNATVTNGAFVVAALLYGQADFRETLRLTFALGYDADCNAATCGAVLGVLHGAKALEAHEGWVLPERYDNVTRDGLPKTQTMAELVAMTARLAEKAIVSGGGRREEAQGEVSYVIPVETPGILERLEDGLPAGTRDEVDAAIDKEAAEHLAVQGAAARILAAIRLSHRSPTGPVRDQVERILRDARKDEVFGALARERLKRLAETPAAR
ncbi:ADP-ribosylglycohydrolase family protein [bacterium]|nr:ADP-ribosylglycohydrolase family protein [bacterium]